MANMINFFELAQLAEASYASFDRLAPKDALTNRDDDLGSLMGFSDTQADLLLAEWKLVENGHQPNTASGFSSTLFQDRDDPMKFVLAIRGTEPDTWGSLIEDAGDILVDGIAIDQIVDLYNEWQRISEDSYHAAYLETLTIETDLYRLAKLGQAITIGPNSWAAEAYIDYLRSRTDVIIDEPSATVKTIRFEETASSGLGLNIDPGNLTVTGHSLGGHLAVAFTRLFPEVGAYAFTVNGAGFATGEVSVPLLGLSAETNIRNLFKMLDEPEGPHSGDGFDSAKILNLYGDRYPEIVTDNGELGLYQQGGHLPIYIEHVSLSDALGHSGQGMTDSLAVYDLFIELDSGLQDGYASETLAKLKPIFEAASNDDGQFEGITPKPNASLESIVNALADLFNTGVKIRDTETDQREALYKAIDAIRKDFDYIRTQGLLTVEPLTGLSRNQIVAKAQLYTAERN